MIEPDPEYDWVPPLSRKAGQMIAPPKLGTQCGECGMKFEYGKAYGYCCMNSNCPTGWGGR